MLLIVLYCLSNPDTHLGSFFGNAIADWTGVVVTVVMTKYLYEKGSAESKQPKGKLPSAITEFVREHSLTLFLLVTGLGWVIAFRAMRPNSRWGQVVGNIVSEWTQILGLVLMTKRLTGGRIERDRPLGRAMWRGIPRSDVQMHPTYDQGRTDASVSVDWNCRTRTGNSFLRGAFSHQSFPWRQSRRHFRWHYHPPRRKAATRSRRRALCCRSGVAGSGLAQGGGVKGLRASLSSAEDC